MEMDPVFSLLPIWITAKWRFPARLPEKFGFLLAGQWQMLGTIPPICPRNQCTNCKSTIELSSVDSHCRHFRFGKLLAAVAISSNGSTV